MAEDLRTERKGRILAVRDLPTLPKVLEEVSKLVERPDSTTEQVAKLISMDQVLSAKVLKMVNSPVYATGVGLVVYGSKNATVEFPTHSTKNNDDTLFRRVARRMKEWFGEFF